MKAILLAAGYGTRLRPITEKVPKCLVKINGKPLLGYWLEKLVNLGVEEVLINAHYKVEQVTDYLKKHPLGSKVKLIYEPTLLGTGGTLMANQAFWQNSTTIVAHADNYTTDDLSGLIECHKSNSDQTNITMLLFRTTTPKSCGIVNLDSKNRVIEYYEKPSNPISNLANGATFVFSPDVFIKYFSHLEKGQHIDLCAEVVPNMVGDITGWLTQRDYIDIGSPETLKIANSYSTPLKQ